MIWSSGSIGAIFSLVASFDIVYYYCVLLDWSENSQKSAWNKLDCLLDPKLIISHLAEMAERYIDLIDRLWV